MKNKKFFISVVVVFVVLLAFFVFFYGFKAVRTQFGLAHAPGPVNAQKVVAYLHQVPAVNLALVTGVGNGVEQVESVDVSHVRSSEVGSTLDVNVVGEKVSQAAERVHQTV